MVMAPISGNKCFRELCEEHPDKLGYIIGPSYYQRPKHGIQFALDNDAFKCWKEGTQFDFPSWVMMLSKVAKTGMEPRFCVVPDVVGDYSATLKSWEKYAKVVELFGFKSAFVLQDGIQIGQVPPADVYFVGGSTEFKWKTAHFWTKHLPKVHVGRVRSKRLHYCEQIKADSCDGSGWMRESTGRPFQQLTAFIKGQWEQTPMLFNPDDIRQALSP